jgi:repressor LexA
MEELTKRQQQVLDYIVKCQQTGGLSPSMRDIMLHFGFRSPRTVSDHVDALRRKNVLFYEPGKRAPARSLRVISPWDDLKKRVMDLPLLGSIPAGLAQELWQEARGCVSVAVGTLGFKPTAKTYALKVKGDSMIGKHILDGDIVVIEHGQTPRNGDVVAALIDGESTLKTLVKSKGKPHLKAENPRYPKLIPATELISQGVMVALIRKVK